MEQVPKDMQAYPELAKMWQFAKYMEQKLAEALQRDDLDVADLRDMEEEFEQIRVHGSLTLN